MKAKFKLKLNKESMQGFFLENGEKLVFGLVALGGLLMISQALTRKNYERKPDELILSSEEANQKIDHTPPDAIPPECHSAEFEKLVRHIELTVEPLAYDYRNPWDNPVVKPLKLRPQPQLFAALQLHGVAGAGRFKVRADGRPARARQGRYSAGQSRQAKCPGAGGPARPGRTPLRGADRPGAPGPTNGGLPGCLRRRRAGPGDSITRLSTIILLCSGPWCILAARARNLIGSQKRGRTQRP